MFDVNNYLTNPLDEIETKPYYLYDIMGCQHKENFCGTSMTYLCLRYNALLKIFSPDYATPNNAEQKQHFERMYRAINVSFIILSNTDYKTNYDQFGTIILNNFLLSIGITCDNELKCLCKGISLSILGIIDSTSEIKMPDSNANPAPYIQTPSISSRLSASPVPSIPTTPVCSFASLESSYASHGSPHTPYESSYGSIHSIVSSDIFTSSSEASSVPTGSSFTSSETTLTSPSQSCLSSVSSFIKSPNQQPSDFFPNARPLVQAKDSFDRKRPNSILLDNIFQTFSKRNRREG